MDMEADMARFVKSFTLAILGATALTTPAFARDTEVTPYIEVGQVLTADIKGGNGDVVTYSTVAAGIDASVTGRQGEFQVSYRYERRFDYQKAVNSDDVHTGIARGRIDVVPNMLSLEVGGIATRARTDSRGSSSVQDVGNISNQTQVYSGYAGPSFATNLGPVDVAAAYRFSYTKASTVSAVTLPSGQDRLDNFDDSKAHYATASIGMQSGYLPFGWTVSGGYERESAGQLDQRYEGKNVRGDINVPLTQDFSVVGGVGYEKIKITQKAPLLDVTGAPVLDADGRYVTDPASPRLLAYDLDGLYWDAGVVWQPSARTQLEARVGHRYGSMSYTGSFTWQTAENSGVQVVAYDEVETFGQQVGDNLSRMPVNFRATRTNGLTNNYGGCVFGGSYGGTCLNDSFQSVNTSAYRSRGVAIVYSSQHGRVTSGLGIGYNQRKFLSPTGALGQVTIDGVKEQNWYAQANLDYALTQQSSISGDFFTGLSKSGLAGAGDVWSTGATLSYFHNFGRSLSTSLSAGLYSQKVENLESTVNVSANAGVRYSF
jgi:hypothetical protein